MSGRCNASVAKEQAVSPFTKSDGVSGYGGGYKPVGVKKWIEKYTKTIKNKIKSKSDDNTSSNDNINEGVEITNEGEIIPENEEERKFESDRHNGSEFVNPKSPTIPEYPSKEEYIKHQITHIPFQNWCPVCVKNAAVNIPHRLSLIHI